jgi:hypothetical protein
MVNSIIYVHARAEPRARCGCWAGQSSAEEPADGPAAGTNLGLETIVAVTGMSAPRLCTRSGTLSPPPCPARARFLSGRAYPSAAAEGYHVRGVQITGRRSISVKLGQSERRTASRSGGRRQLQRRAAAAALPGPGHAQGLLRHRHGRGHRQRQCCRVIESPWPQFASEC